MIYSKSENNIDHTVNNTSTAVCKKNSCKWEYYGTELKYFHTQQNMELMKDL